MAAVAEPEMAAGPSGVTRPVSGAAEQASALTPPQKQILYENAYITSPGGFGEVRPSLKLHAH